MFTAAIRNSPCFPSDEGISRIKVLPLAGEVAVIFLVVGACLSILYSLNVPVSASYALIGVASGGVVALFGEFIFLIIQSVAQKHHQVVDDIFGWGWGIPNIDDIKRNPELYLNEQGGFCVERLNRFAPLFYIYKEPKLKGVDAQGRQFFVLNFLISEEEQRQGHGIVLIFQNEVGGNAWSQVSQVYDYGKQDAVVNGFEGKLKDIEWLQKLVHTGTYDLS